MKCPECGSIQDVTVWNSITAADSSDLKAELLQGKINMFECSVCGHKALMPAPLLYDDKEKRLLISFTPASDRAEINANFEELTKNTKKSVDLSAFEGYNLRYVHDYNSLMEKLLIFDAGLSDKTIEVLKLMILNSEPEKADRRRCMFGKADDEAIEFAVYDTEEQQMYTSRVPRSSYDTVHAELAASGVKPYSFNWELVDINYAAALINGINNM